MRKNADLEEDFVIPIKVSPFKDREKKTDPPNKAYIHIKNEQISMFSSVNNTSRDISLPSPVASVPSLKSSVGIKESALSNRNRGQGQS